MGKKGGTILSRLRDDIKVAKGGGNKYLTPEQREEIKTRKIKIDRVEGNLPGNRKWRREMKKKRRLGLI